MKTRLKASACLLIVLWTFQTQIMASAPVCLEAVGHRLVNAGPQETGTSRAESGAQLVAMTEDGQAQLAYGAKLGGEGGFWRLMVASPLSGGEAEFANLDGLASSTNVKLQLSFSSDVGKDSARRGELCERLAAQRIEADSQLRATLSNNLRQAYRADPPLIRSFAVEIGAGTEDFEHFQAGLLETTDTSRTPAAAGIKLSLHRPDKWFVELGARAERVYEAAADVTRCPASAPGTVVDCATGAGDPPNRKDTQIAYVEAKYALGRVGLAPRISYETEDDVLGVDLPIYFVRGPAKEEEAGSRKAADLTAGIRLGWRDDTNDFEAGLFFGIPFDLSKK